LICQGGLYLNNEKVTNENMVIGEDVVVDDSFLLLRKGKDKNIIIKFSE
jgi:tyrosyl-tRNA synthetase